MLYNLVAYALILREASRMKESTGAAVLYPRKMVAARHPHQ